MFIPRMRTVRQCVAYIKEHDPDTAVGEYYIRGLIAQNLLPVLKAGRKNLINLDSLLKILNMEEIKDA